MTWLSCRWLWLVVCKSAGVTKQEVRIYRKNNKGKLFINKKTYLWFVHQSTILQSLNGHLLLIRH